MNIRPKPRREFLPLERLLFLREYQHRIGEQLFDEAHVERLLEALEAGETFDALEVVETSKAEKKLPKFIVIDGFNRGEALRRRGVASAECVVYQGSEADARFWSLSSNSKHGKHRTPDECRAIFDKLLASPTMLNRAIEAARGNGGTERGIARATGLSGGAVSKYLAAAGLRVDRITARLIPAEAESPERLARVALADEMKAAGKSAAEAARELGVGPETLAADRRKVEARAARAGGKVEQPDSGAEHPARAGEEAPAVEVVKTADALAGGARDAIKEAQGMLRAVGRIAESLLRSQVGDHLRQAAKGRKLPLAVKTEDRNADINDLATKTVEFWPALADMQAVFADVAAVLHAGG